jgi:RNA polymerase sigma-70 factor (ECF subfamily)
MTLPDKETFKALSRGDQSVFQQVFDACYEKLCHYAFTILKDMDEAEDVVQSIFIKLWEKREELDIKQTIRAYLFKAVYHRCINVLEHRTIKLRHQEHGSRDVISHIQLPEVFPQELEERIKKAIDTLPPQCRTVFMMSRYEEMRYSEIADKLDISVNTVENQISKALKILRSQLKDNFV